MAVPTFLSKNWPPRCIEIVAPNSTVLHKELLEELCDVLQLRGQRLDKSKLRSIIRALDRYYQVRGRAAFLSHVRKSSFRYSKLSRTGSGGWSVRMRLFLTMYSANGQHEVVSEAPL